MTLAIIALVIAQGLYLCGFWGETSKAQPNGFAIGMLLTLLVLNAFALGSLVDKVLP